MRKKRKRFDGWSHLSALEPPCQPSNQNFHDQNHFQKTARFQIFFSDPVEKQRESFGTEIIPSVQTEVCTLERSDSSARSS